MTDKAGNPIISSARNEVEQMLKQVEKLKSFLGDPAIQGQEGFKVLAMEMREVVYAAEDISDSFVMLDLQSRLELEHKICCTCFLPNHQARHLRLAKHLISFTKTRLTPILKKIHPIPQTIPMTNPYTRPETQIVGLGEEAEMLMKNVISEEMERLDVISITGMPGIGKSTLAWKIYQDQKMEQEFPTRIWINLAQGLDKNDIYLHIMRELSLQNRHSGLPPAQHDGRVDRPFEFLRNIKFLLVLDNVWTVDDWNAIKDVLPIGNKSGKVLITSQDESVCMLASPDRKPHKVRFLNKDDSWELLQLQVFGKLNIICPDSLRDVGKTVAENCDGLPFAIQIIASNLVVAASTKKAEELTGHWWKKVGENVSMYVTQYKKQGSPSILELSFNVLPPQLRDCFLYLGVFPEDYEIPTRTLTRLWIAEGFIQNKEQKSLEETAEDVLEDLVRSNLVIVVGELDYNGKVKRCRVHKVIHGFCKSKALEQINLFQEIKMSVDKAFDPPLSLTPNHRRLSIHSNLCDYLSRKPDGPGVRSFLCFQKESNKDVLETKHTSTIHKSFKFLKVFESKSINSAEFPIKLTKLLNLTYISLRCARLAVLPETICDLVNLQTLIVETGSPVLEIKGDIWRMIKLRHLITKAAITLPKQLEAGQGNGELQTLSRLQPEYRTKNVFRKAPNLKKLGLSGRLTEYHLRRWNDEAPGQMYSRSLFPRKLTSLTLSATYLDWEHMRRLGQMVVNLNVLKLKDNAGWGDSWTIYTVFRRLKLLVIDGSDLVNWEASTNSFPSLRRLVLRNCKKLDKIPLRLAPALETLKLQHVSESAEKWGREMKEIAKEELRELDLSILPQPRS